MLFDTSSKYIHIDLPTFQKEFLLERVFKFFFEAFRSILLVTRVEQIVNLIYGFMVV